jgi:hypothetical protein
MNRLLIASAAAALLAASASSEAAVVANTLPYPGTPDWRTVIFGGTTMVKDASTTTLTTAQGQGVWFGWTAGATSWSLSGNGIGNEMGLTMRLTSGSRDWSAYMADGARFAGFLFNPTGCDGNVQNCTNAPFQNGVSLSFAANAAGSGTKDSFVPLDLTKDNVFGFEMKDNMVRYRINNSFYTGFAQAVNYAILVIGDGSGSTLTGNGSMIVSAASFDNGPIDAISAVPEPGSWALMISGFGLAGAASRRRRRRASLA